MKSFKQIDLRLENRMVFSYALMLCFLCSFIMLNPLFGQEKDEQNHNKPEVQIDVNKECDENGNVVGYDSTYKWFWSGSEITDMNFDSIFEKFHNDFDHWNDNFERNHFEPFGYFHYPGGQWNHFDSSLYTNLNDLIDEEFLDRFNFNHDFFPFYDSTITSHFDLNDFNQKFNRDDFFGNEELIEKLNEDQEAYMERFRRYQKEHQQLIEKYFGEPNNGEDNDIEYKQQKYTPIKINSNNTGLI